MAARMTVGISESVARLNPDVAHLFPRSEPVPACPLVDPADVDSDERPPINEDELQSACEKYLAFRGYARLTAENARNVNECVLEDRAEWFRGWFGHQHENRKNTFLPDLFIFSRDTSRPPLFVELKTRERYQKGQREMIRMGYWKLARSLDDLIELLAAWEGPAT